MSSVTGIYGSIFLVNIIMAFYLLPWSISRKYSIVTACMVASGYTVMVVSLIREFTMMYAMSTSLLMTAICFMAASHLAKKKPASHF